MKKEKLHKFYRQSPLTILQWYIYISLNWYFRIVNAFHLKCNKDYIIASKSFLCISNKMSEIDGKAQPKKSFLRVFSHSVLLYTEVLLATEKRIFAASFFCHSRENWYRAATLPLHANRHSTLQKQYKEEAFFCVQKECRPVDCTQ